MFFNTRSTKGYWQAAVQNWGSGVHSTYWPTKESARMRLEIYRAASRYM